MTRDPRTTLRLPTPDDAPALADLLTRNRAFFRTGEPLRPDEYYTPAHQGQVIRDAARAWDAGTARMYLVEHDGVLVGRANLSSIIRGAFQSASVGYVVDEAHTGRGIATAALRALVAIAFDELGLHRLQGETLVDNRASQAVLTRCGFRHYGTAPGLPVHRRAVADPRAVPADRPHLGAVMVLSRLRRWVRRRRADRDRAAVLRRLGDCARCAHPWSEHPGAWPGSDDECGECRYEVQHDQADAGQPCDRPCPLLPTEQVAALAALWARVPASLNPAAVDADGPWAELDAWFAGAVSSHAVDERGLAWPAGLCAHESPCVARDLARAVMGPPPAAVARVRRPAPTASPYQRTAVVRLRRPEVRGPVEPPRPMNPRSRRPGLADGAPQGMFRWSK